MLTPIGMETRPDHCPIGTLLAISLVLVGCGAEDRGGSARHAAWPGWWMLITRTPSPNSPSLCVCAVSPTITPESVASEPPT
jgi:hypothetical protein